MPADYPRYTGKGRDGCPRNCSRCDTGPCPYSAFVKMDLERHLPVAKGKGKVRA
jgi:hypothetical protein